MLFYGGSTSYYREVNNLFCDFLPKFSPIEFVISATTTTTPILKLTVWKAFQ
jgi:hypothetical protein